MTGVYFQRKVHISRTRIKFLLMIWNGSPISASSCIIGGKESDVIKNAKLVTH